MSLPKKKLDKALNNSIKEGAAYSAMDGITTTYTTPFALALGANDFIIGILNSAPNFFVTLSQLFAGKYIERMGSKNVAVSLSFLHRFIWFVIMFIPLLFYQDKLLLFIALIIVSSIVSNLALTAWSSWIGCLVPEKIRGSFFGKRSTIISMFNFLTTFGAGWILGLADGTSGFTIIFFLAFVLGMVSYSYLNRIPEVKYCIVGKKKKLNVTEFVRDMRKYKNFKPFVRYMALVLFAASIASPFFTVYMLEVMGIGYTWYGIVIGMEILTKVIMLRYWGRLSDTLGDKTIMALCSVLISLYPFLFLFAMNPFHLILLGIISGIGWSGFDLTSFNYLLDVTPKDKRPSYIANYKVYVGFAMFLGPLIGGLLSQFLVNSTLIWLSGLQIVFFLSFVLRISATAYGLPMIKEVRAKREMPVTDVFVQAFVKYPIRGITHDIIYIHHKVEDMEKKLKSGMKGIV
jgi:MFS family permease